MRIAKYVNIIAALCCCVFGIIVISLPQLTDAQFRISAGVILIASGVFRIGGYFSKDLFRLAFEYDLQLGILSIAAGAAVLCKSERVIEFALAVYGTVSLTDGLFKVKIAFDSKKFGISRWYVILAAAIIASLAGAAFLFFTQASARVMSVLFGAVMITHGISNLAVIIFTFKIINHQQPDGFDKKEL